MEHEVLRDMVDKWVVRILLECFLVLNMSMQYLFDKLKIVEQTRCYLTKLFDYQN